MLSTAFSHPFVAFIFHCDKLINLNNDYNPRVLYPLFIFQAWPKNLLFITML